ncbi:MAG: hypothetical protein M1541_21285 [Acidobacteria bacterium]|nr:hypothetical protein [Acidobacteriota bacterium]
MADLLQSIPSDVEEQAPATDSNEADVHLTRLLVAGVEEPWYRSLFQSIRDIVKPQKLPPLEVTSKPVVVKDIWGLYGKKRSSGVMSLAIHASVVVLLFTVASSRAVQNQVKQIITPIIAPD